MGVVGELGDGNVVAVANLEIVLLEAELEDECVGILDTVAEPYANEEGHPVEVDAIVEIVEAGLVLIDEVGREHRGAKAERRGAARLFGDVEKASDVTGEFDGHFGDAIETIGGLCQVGG